MSYNCKSEVAGRVRFAMTLRLDPGMETELENLAYTLRLSKAGTIRRALRRAIAEAHQTELPNCNVERQGTL